MPNKARLYPLRWSRSTFLEREQRGVFGWRPELGNGVSAVRVQQVAAQRSGQPNDLVGPGRRVGPVGLRGIQGTTGAKQKLLKKLWFKELPLLSKSCWRSSDSRNPSVKQKLLKKLWFKELPVLSKSSWRSSDSRNPSVKQKLLKKLWFKNLPVLNKSSWRSSDSRNSQC
jgi:hypothetical protein